MECRFIVVFLLWVWDPNCTHDACTSFLTSSSTQRILDNVSYNEPLTTFFKCFYCFNLFNYNHITLHFLCPEWCVPSQNVHDSFCSTHLLAPEVRRIDSFMWNITKSLRYDEIEVQEPISVAECHTAQFLLFGADTISQYQIACVDWPYWNNTTTYHICA